MLTTAVTPNLDPTSQPGEGKWDVEESPSEGSSLPLDAVGVIHTRHDTASSPTCQEII